MGGGVQRIKEGSGRYSRSNVRSGMNERKERRLAVFEMEG